MSTPPLFDPRAVPARPVVDVRFDTDGDGREIAVVDGLPIRRAPSETARESAFRTVADLVDRIASVGESGRRSPAVRARVHGPQGASQIFVVHRERRVFVPAQSGTHIVDGNPQTVSTPSEAGRAAAQPGAEAAWVEGSNRWPGTAAVAVTGAPRKAAAAPWVPQPSEPTPRRMRSALVTEPTPPPAAPPGAVTRLATTSENAMPSAATSESTPQPAARPSASGATAPAPRATTWEPGPRADARSALPSSATPPADAVPPGRVRREHAARGREEDAAATLLRRARTTRPTPSPRPARVRPAAVARRPRSVAPTLAAAAAVVAVSAGALAWSLGRPHSAAPDVAARASLAAPALPVAAPAGWQRTSRWATPALLPAAGATVVVDDAVAYVTLQRRLTVIDAMSGRARWSVDLPAGDVHAGPARTTLRGADVLAMHVGDRLLAWRATDGAAQTPIQLPAAAAVTYLGAAPLVGLRPDTVGVVRDDRLLEVAVPGGATPLAASADGTVTAASPAGWWHLRADVAAPLPTPWESAVPGAGEGARPSIVGYVDSSIVTVEAADSSGRPHVVVHTDRPADVRVSFRGALAGAAKGLRWSRSPSGTWGVLGRTLVDVRAGSVTDLGAWSTTWVAHDRAYGTIAGKPLVAGPDVARGMLPVGAPVVEAMSRQGGAVRVADAAGQRVYFLPPAQ